MFEYKGYLGKFEHNSKTNTFHGEVVNINDVITFQGKSPEELKQAFENSIDDYIEFCIQKGKNPEKPLTG